MEVSRAANQLTLEQWLADLEEDMELVHYPTRRRLIQMIEEAARSAESRRRLEYALLTHR